MYVGSYPFGLPTAVSTFFSGGGTILRTILEFQTPISGRCSSLLCSLSTSEQKRKPKKTKRKAIKQRRSIIRMTISGLPSPKGRVLIAGATGFIGQFVAEASLDAHKPTYILLRPGLRNPCKAKTIKALEDKGAIVVQGLINEQESMEKILKEHKIDIVISAVGGANILDQITLVKAMKAVGTIKRFLPSEFGHDVNRADPVEPGLTMYKEKRRVRQSLEESGVPFTYICCNSIVSWPYYDNIHPSEVLPPMDYFQIYGDGKVKAYFVAGTDIGKFTMRAVDDARTLNKSVHFRPACNCLSMNELASLWEKKIGRTLPRVTVTEDDLLALAGEHIIPRSVVASFTHDIFIKGCQVNFSVDGPEDVEVTTLYPEASFRTVEECFDEYTVDLETPLQAQAQSQSQLQAAPDAAPANPGSVVDTLPVTATCA